MPNNVKDEQLLNDIRIVQVIPCLANPDKIRFTADFKKDISEVFPYVNAVLNGAIYNHAGKTLTLRRDGRLITLHSKSISASKINDVRDAHATIDWLIALLNECHHKRFTINPCFERRDRLNVIDVVRLLPGTNCKKCCQPTCLSFAAMLAAEKESIAACRDIFLAEYGDKRTELLALLRAGGYAVPDVFH